jgi:hypothetical protein
MVESQRKAEMKHFRCESYKSRWSSNSKQECSTILFLSSCFSKYHTTNFSLRWIWLFFWCGGLIFFLFFSNVSSSVATICQLFIKKYRGFLAEATTSADAYLLKGEIVKEIYLNKFPICLCSSNGSWCENESNVTCCFFSHRKFSIWNEYFLIMCFPFV